MALSKRTITILSVTGLAAAAFSTLGVSQLSSQANETPQFGDNDDCGKSNLKEISVYSTGSTASYNSIHCEVDEFGKVIVTEGEFTVDLSNSSDAFVVAALGQEGANDIRNILTELNNHADKFEPTNSRIVEGMSCEPSAEFKGIEMWGDMKVGIVETRKDFFNPMPWVAGCEISLHSIFGDLSYLDNQFGPEAAEQIRQIMGLASQPLAPKLEQ